MSNEEDVTEEDASAEEAGDEMDDQEGNALTEGSTLPAIGIIAVAVVVGGFVFFKKKQ